MEIIYLRYSKYELDLKDKDDELAEKVLKIQPHETKKINLSYLYLYCRLNLC